LHGCEKKNLEKKILKNRTGFGEPKQHSTVYKPGEHLC